MPVRLNFKKGLSVIQNKTIFFLWVLSTREKQTPKTN